MSDAYLTIFAENGDDVVYDSDRIFEFRDIYGTEQFGDIWKFQSKEQLADYKLLDDFIYAVYDVATNESEYEFDTVRVIFSDLNGEILGLSIKFNYDPEWDEFDYIIYDWRDAGLYKFAGG